MQGLSLGFQLDLRRDRHPFFSLSAPDTYYMLPLAAANDASIAAALIAHSSRAFVRRLRTAHSLVLYVSTRSTTQTTIFLAPPLAGISFSSISISLTLSLAEQFGAHTTNLPTLETIDTYSLHSQYYCTMHITQLSVCTGSPLESIPIHAKPAQGTQRPIITASLAWTWCCSMQSFCRPYASISSR